MISYELAKKLKDAGFPQKKTLKSPLLIFYTKSGLIRREGIHIISYEDYENIYKIPTLSELIEACEYDFHLLEKELNTPNYWRCLTIINGNQIRTIGSTPEEAVAKLWLSIDNKKNVDFLNTFKEAIEQKNDEHNKKIIDMENLKKEIYECVDYSPDRTRNNLNKVFDKLK